MKRFLAISAIAVVSITAPLFAQSADVSVVKSGPASALAGSDVSYDITVTNNGPDPATDVTLGDDIPTGMTFLSGGQNSGTPFSCSTPPAGSGGSISCTATVVPPGTATFTFVFRIPPETPNGTFTNTATISSTTADPAPGDHSSSVDTLVHGFVDLSVSKSGPAEALADTDVSYSVVVTNGGPNDASSVLLKDFVPAGMDFVSTSQVSGPPFSCAGAPVLGAIDCTAASLPAGDSAEITFVFHIPAGTPAGTTFTNVATATATNPDSNEENDSGSATTTTPPPPQSDMAITKTGPSSAGPDTDVVYTITLTNHGPDAAAGVTLTDPLPFSSPSGQNMTFVSLSHDSNLSCSTPAVGAEGTVSCSGGTLAAGETVTFTLTTHIPSGATSGTSYTNTATTSTTTADPTDENDSSSTTLFVSSVDVGVTKTGPGTADAGTNITYTITVSNAGPDTASNVTFTDPLPAQTTFVSLTQPLSPASNCSTPLAGTNGTVSCTIPLLGVESAQFQLTIRIGNTTLVTNPVTVTTESFDSDPSNQDASATTTVTPIADVHVTKNGPATMTAGANFTYTIVVANDGPSDAANVSLDDTLPANVTVVSASQTSGPAFTCTFPAPGTTGAIDCDIATLAPNASATFTINANLAASTASSSTVTNTANVTLATADPDGGDHTSMTSANVVTSADLAVTKSGPALVQAGTNYTYTIALTNNGPSDASTVSLDDTLPANVTVVSASQTSGPSFTCVFPPPGTTGAVDCDIATFVAGASATFSITVTLSPAAQDGSTVSNTATLTSATPDSNGANNTSTTNATVGAEADVSVTKTGPASVIAGHDVSYTVTVTNAGPANATNVTLTDVVPANTVFVSAMQNSGPLFTCATPSPFGTGTITCTIASMPASSTSVFTFTFRVTGGGPIENTATVSSPNDVTPGNGSSSATTNVSHGGDAPTLSQWGLILLALSLGMIVMLRLR